MDAPKQPRRCRIYVRFTAAERAAIKTAAELVGKSVSDWVREVLLVAAQKQLRKRSEGRP
jgi:uncharacterized protein (DUF1778 family)